MKFIDKFIKAKPSQSKTILIRTKVNIINQTFFHKKANIDTMPNFSSTTEPSNDTINMSEIRF